MNLFNIIDMKQCISEMDQYLVIYLSKLGIFLKHILNFAS